MHKKIAYIINKIVKESPYNSFMKCRLRSSPTNGFWGLTIRFTERDNAHAEALVRALPLIGTIYGEGLCINESEDKMIYEVS